MDPLNETAYLPQLAPLLMWIKVIEVCASILLLLALVTMLATWVWQLSWRMRLSALVPLAAGTAAGIAAHALHSWYVYWTNSALFTPRTSPGHVTPQYIADVLRLLRPFEDQFTSDLHTATILGWGILVVTAILVALGLLGTWRLVAAGRHKPLPASWASEP
jgi:hypothetical protein